MGVVQLLNLGLPLLSLPYLATTLGAEQLGRMAFALSIGQLLVILTDYGFNLSGPKAVAINRENRQRITEIWCTVTLVRAMLAFSGFLIIYLSTFISNKLNGEFDLFLTAYAMVIGNILFPQWLFLGLEKLIIVSTIQVIARIISFLGIFIFVKNENDVYMATFLQAGGLLLGGIFALPYTAKEICGCKVSWPKVSAVREQLKNGWHIFLSTAAINIYTASNALILGLVSNPTVVGQYHVAERLIRAAQALYAPISNAIYPHVARMVTKNQIDALIFIRKVLISTVAISAILAIGIYFISPFAVRLIFGNSYEHATTILRIMSIMLPISIASNILAIQTMLPFSLEAKLSRILLSAAIFDFIIFIPLARFFEASGAAWANVAVEIFVATMCLIVLQNQNKNPIVIRASKNKES